MYYPHTQAKTHHPAKIQARWVVVIFFAAWLGLALNACAKPPEIGGILEPKATLKLDVGDDAVSKIAISPDGRLVAAIPYLRHNLVWVWDVKTQKILYKLPHRYISYHSGLAFTPDGKYLITGDFVPRTERILKNEQGQPLRDKDGKERLRDLPPEERFTGHLWDMQTGTQAKTYRYVNDQRDVCWFSNLQIRADGKQFASGGQNGITICDLQTGKRLKEIRYPWLDATARARKDRANAKPYLGTPEAFVVLPDWNYLVVATNRYYPRWRGDIPDKNVADDGEIVLVWLDAKTGEMEREITISSRLPGGFMLPGLAGYTPFALAPNGRLLAVNSWYSHQGGNPSIKDRARIKVLNQQTGAVAMDLLANASQVAFSPDSNSLITAGDGIYIWDIVSGKLRAKFIDHNVAGQRHFVHITLSSGGDVLAAAGGNTVYIWSAKTREAT